MCVCGLVCACAYASIGVPRLHVFLRAVCLEGKRTQLRFVSHVVGHELTPTYTCAKPAITQLKKLEEFKGNRDLLSKADQFVWTVS